MKNQRLVLIGLILCLGLSLGLWIISGSDSRISKAEVGSGTSAAETSLSLSEGEMQDGEPSDDRRDSDPNLLSKRKVSPRYPRLPIPSQERLDDSLQKLGITQVDLKKIKEELKNDGTHHTPQSYLELATKVGERVDQLEEPMPLSTCALAPQVQADFYLPLAALCLSFLNELAIKTSKQSAPEASTPEAELGAAWKLYQQTLQSVDPAVRELSTAALDEN